PGFQNVGTGADGIAVVIAALGLPRGRGMYRIGLARVGHQRWEVYRRVIEVIDQRQFVRRLNIVDVGDIEGAAALVGGIFLPVEIRFESGGVERRTIVELDARTQLEGTHLEVLGWLPVLCQLRLR